MHRADFLEHLRMIEAKWQKRWTEDRVFEPRPEEGKEKYFITVPYPYTNGPLHIGHGRTYTIGDIVARYKRLRGYNVLFPMAFHITGTPIIAISERISRGDEKVIQMYKHYVGVYVSDEEKIDEIVKEFKDPLRLATFFAERIHSDFSALGYSIDWRRKFHTGEPIYNAFVTWQFLRLRDLGLITQGDHVVTYCLLHRQPEGEDDIKDADTNPVEILEFTAIKFELADEPKTYLVAATLRPETIFGATNLWVNPDAMYVVVEWKGEKIILSDEALVKLRHQHPEDEIKELKKFRGRELVGKIVYSPLGSKLYVLPARFVDPDNATGVVYSEPSDAPYDYVALMELKKNKEILREYGLDPAIMDSIEPIKIIEVPGIEGHHAAKVVEELGISRQDDARLEEATKKVYREQYYRGKMIVEHPEFHGMPVKEAKDKVRSWLIRNGFAFIFYELNRKAVCRAGGKIIVAKIKGQWFIDYSVPWWKERARKYLTEIVRILPEKYRKAFLDIVDWIEKRPCARRRGLGTRLPFDREWIIESLSDSTIYMAFYTIAHIIRRENIKPEQLKPEFFDYVFLGKGEPEKVAAETGISRETIEEMRREFTYWYPVDQRHTGIAHISNHLTFFIFHHLALFPEHHWPRMISLNEMVIREGVKMSKSKGNVILLRDIVTKYSADLFRLYIAGAANLDSILDWREAEVSMTIDALRRFYSLCLKAVEAEPLDKRDRLIDRWFFSRFNKIIDEAAKHLDKMEIRDYVQTIFYKAMSIIEHYRERTSQEEAIRAVRAVLDKWLVALNPVIPHLTEEIGEKLGYKQYVSLMKWPESSKEEYDDVAELIEDSIVSFIDDVKNVLNVIKEKPTKITIVIADQWKRELARLVEENKSLRETIRILRDKYGLRGKEKEIVAAYNMLKKNKIPGSWRIGLEEEMKGYMEAASYIARKTGLEVEILSEQEARANSVPKADKALPLRPAFYIE